MTSARREPMVSVVFFVLRGGILDVVEGLSSCCAASKMLVVEAWSIFATAGVARGKSFLRAVA
jgi:hypothetical protein